MNDDKPNLRSKGGIARAKNLTAKKRKEIAIKNDI